jgi:hypothetical protein
LIDEAFTPETLSRRLIPSIYFCLTPFHHYLSDDKIPSSSSHPARHASASFAFAALIYHDTCRYGSW